MVPKALLNALTETGEEMPPPRSETMRWSEALLVEPSEEIPPPPISDHKMVRYLMETIRSAAAHLRP